MATRKQAQKSSEPTSAYDWDTLEKRIKWLLETAYQGNRSEMARKTGLSHTAISKAASGEKPPGRRMLTAIVEKLNVSSDWLLLGRGQPFSSSPDAPDAPFTMPVSDRLLPERLPKKLRTLTSDRIVVPGVRVASQYWFALGRGEAILGDPRRGFVRGDVILLETDPERFPALESFGDTLCVVKDEPTGKPAVQLGSVTYTPASEEGEAARLTVESFEPTAPDPDAISVEDHVFRRHPDGRVEPIHRKGWVYKSRGSERFVRLDHVVGKDEGLTREIQPSDIVAIWTGILLRSPYMKYV